MPIEASNANPIQEVDLASTNLSNEEKANRILIDKVPLNAKPQVYDIRVHQDAYLDFLFTDDAGNPQDLDNLPGVGFKAYIRESVAHGHLHECAVSVVDADKGKLQIHVSPKESHLPGIFNGSVICYPLNNPQAIIKECPFYLYITYGINSVDTNGPLSLVELRLYLRDTSPEENLLIDGLNFTDEEILLATKLTIQKFNDIPPRENFPVFNSTNFPFKSILMDGVLGQLFFMAAEYHRKNNLQYSAGGVSLNDKNKEPNYLQAANMHWQEFLQNAKAEKVKLNMDLNWGTISSPYAYTWY